MDEQKKNLLNLIRWKNRPIVKIVTGEQGSGKSLLMKRYRDYLRDKGVYAEHIVAVDLCDPASKELCCSDTLLAFVMEQVRKNGRHHPFNDKKYVFLENMQMIADSQTVISALCFHKEIDLCISNSNCDAYSDIEINEGDCLVLEMSPAPMTP